MLAPIPEVQPVNQRALAASCPETVRRSIWQRRYRGHHPALLRGLYISTAVYAASSNDSRSGTRDTMNITDSIYNAESPASW